MIQVPRRVVSGGFEWYGLSLSIDGSHFSLTKGRVGTFQNPLRFENGRVYGGWYLPPTDITLSSEISRVDIVYQGQKAFVMFRSSDNAERYPDEFTLLFSLAWRDGTDWYIVVPDRG